ncbi:lipoma-preferred partner homolog [Ischnura elegans]|uniref:lipoma-preferred partner homolog n=1 Tax=Ischnura elegans TaxID=197161 RepID=UPI001ED8B359|nr:lipoma-preferred partner homolog [Ischnura elegans]
MDSHIEQHLAHLQLNGECQTKKVGPAVPPKPKKPQTQIPAVPKSYSLNTPSEPSYSTLLLSGGSSGGSSSSGSGGGHHMHAQIHHPSQSQVPLYSNLPPPVGGSHSSGPQSSKGRVGVVRGSDISSSIYAGTSASSATYSNVGTFSEMDANESGVAPDEDDDDLPPPPPQPPEGEYNNGGGGCPSPLPDDLPPPPPPLSPVSSSYSELRRATGPGGVGKAGGGGVANIPITSVGRMAVGGAGQGVGVEGVFIPDYAHGGPHYGNYGPSSQSSSTYESIYEPINPRPPSQASMRSNYSTSLYSPYAHPPPPPSSANSTLNRKGNSGSGGPQGSGGGAVSPGGTGPKYGQEAEVDALTDLLVQSMDGSADSDFYGICTMCGEKVVGEGSGCTAMDQVYHISCFTCCDCHTQLQGKPFYALDGKPYCEEDYLNTLEKCSVCSKPILDRILRATGKPYHPQCFSCVVCGQSLDGIPFTVDATNQIHCIEDFHKKFAPRCCVCRLPIMPEPGQEETVRVVALDRSFHINCYKCEDCGLVLSSEAEGRGCYPLDDHVLCKSCNAKRVQALTSHMTTEL